MHALPVLREAEAGEWIVWGQAELLGKVQANLELRNKTNIQKASLLSSSLSFCLEGQAWPYALQSFLWLSGFVLASWAARVFSTGHCSFSWTVSSCSSPTPYSHLWIIVQVSSKQCHSWPPFLVTFGALECFSPSVTITPNLSSYRYAVNWKDVVYLNCTPWFQVRLYYLIAVECLKNALQWEIL